MRVEIMVKTKPNQIKKDAGKRENVVAIVVVVVALSHGY